MSGHIRPYDTAVRKVVGDIAFIRSWYSTRDQKLIEETCARLRSRETRRMLPRSRKVKQALECHPMCGRGLDLATVILQKLARYDEAHTFGMGFVEAREDAISKYKQPRYVDAILLHCRGIDEGFDARLLFSLDKTTTRDLTKLAGSSLDQTSWDTGDVVVAYASVDRPTARRLERRTAMATR